MEIFFLSKNKILDELNDGNIMISNFNNKNLNKSYQLTLGESYYKRNNDKKYILSDDNRTMWSNDFFLATYPSYEEIKEYKINTKIITLQPNEVILTHCNEFIGVKNNILATFKGVSSLAGFQINIVNDFNTTTLKRLTVEIKNNSNTKLILKCGTKIVDVLFYRLNCNSQSSLNFEEKFNIEYCEKWTPEDLFNNNPIYDDINSQNVIPLVHECNISPLKQN